jgi:hypothetical protein
MEAWHGTRGIAYSKKPDDFLKIPGIIPQALPAELLPRSGQRGFIAGYRHFAEAIDAAGGATEPVAGTRSRHRRDYDLPTSLMQSGSGTASGWNRIVTCPQTDGVPLPGGHIPKIDRNFS